MESLLRDQFLVSASDSGTKPTIRRLNFSHEAIARWMLENPDKDLGDCAAQFGYTKGWLSIIIHSDAFAAHYRRLQDNADDLVVADIPAKMRGVAGLALEALADQVVAAAEDKTVAPREFLLRTSEALLSKLGYGNNAKGGVNINVPPGGKASVVVVDGDTLDRARAKLVERRANEEKVVEGLTIEPTAS